MKLIVWMFLKPRYYHEIKNLYRLKEKFSHKTLSIQNDLILHSSISLK